MLNLLPGGGFHVALYLVAQVFRERVLHNAHPRPPLARYGGHRDPPQSRARAHRPLGTRDALPEGTETFILLGHRIALERLEPESRPLKTVEPGVELVEVQAGSFSPVIARAYSTSRVRGTSTAVS